MIIVVLAAVLGAALLHSSWHAMIKRAPNRVVGLAGMNVVSVAVGLCAIPFVAVPPPSLWLVLAVSVGLHNAYKVALARLYAVGDLGQAFPMARGMAPLAATVLAGLFLAEWPGGWQLVGIAAISAGLIWLALEGPGPIFNRSIVLAAAVTGSAVAAYSVVDSYGVRLWNDWLSFTVWLVVLDGGTFIALSRWRTGPTFWNSIALRSRAVLVSGGLGVVSFSVFLWALGRAPVGSVTALREVSVLFTSAIGVLALHERTSLTRIAGALLVTGGVALLALS